MVAGERMRAGSRSRKARPATMPAPRSPTLTQAQVDQISAIAQSALRLRDRRRAERLTATSDDRLVAKLDANLSDTQRASLTYIYTKDCDQVSARTPSPPAPTGLGLASNGYVQSNRLHTGVSQLNSDWSDEFSTEVRGFYKDYKRGQDPILGRGFAQFQVCTAPTSDRATAGAAGDARRSTARTGFGTSRSARTSRASPTR